MGAYSSWAAFALCHHLVVYIAAKRAGIARFTNYMLLGDDIVIAHDLVAQEYIKILERLDCPISLAKTHKSRDLFEFAKKIVFQGQEISPFPVSGLQEVVKKYYLLYEFLTEQGNRGFPTLKLYGNPGPVAELLRILKTPSRLIDAILRRTEAWTYLPRKGHGTWIEQGGEFAKAISRLFYLGISCVYTHEHLDRIICRHAREAYNWNMARTAERALNSVQNWYKRINSEMSKNDLGADDQSELIDGLEEMCPPIMVLSAKADES